MSDSFTAAPLRAVAGIAQVVGIVESAKVNIAPLEGPESYRSLLRVFAERRALPFFVMTARGDRPIEFLRRLKPDLICVAGMAQLLRSDEFRLPALGTINLHPSLLPRFRGPKPQVWQSYWMDLQGGVTVHRIDDGIDTGDILCQSEFALPLGMPYAALRRRTLQIGAATMVRAVRRLASGQARWRQQAADLSLPYARKISPDEQLIDWEGWPIDRVWHFLRNVEEEYIRLPLPQGAVRWQIGPIDRQTPRVPAGTIDRDDAGFYVAHPIGRIRLTLHPKRGRLAEKLYWWKRRFRQRWEWR